MIQQRYPSTAVPVTDLFTAHPRALGMSWAGHGAGAIAIGATMIAAGLACIVHALVPGLFTDTAGRTVKALHDRMTTRRADAPRAEAWLEYEI